MGRGKRGEVVARPAKKSEYEIVCITAQAAKGWSDALSQFRNAMADAWDRLTAQPTAVDGQRVYCLERDLAFGSYAGRDYRRYQYKVSDGARIWYFVDETDRRVLVELVATGHPKATE